MATQQQPSSPGAYGGDTSMMSSASYASTPPTAGMNTAPSAAPVPYWKRVLLWIWRSSGTLLWIVSIVVALYLMYLGWSTVKDYHYWLLDCYPTEYQLVGLTLSLWTVWLVLVILKNTLFGESPQGQGMFSWGSPPLLRDKQLLKNMRTFGGTDGIWSDFRTWFDRMAIAHRWSKEEQHTRLLLSLKGRAETFTNGLPPHRRDTLEKVFAELEKRFGLHQQSRIYLAEAQARKIRPRETYREFAQIIEELCRQAFPTELGAMTTFALEIFCKNCGVGAIQESLANAKANTLVEAVTAAQYWKDVVKPIQDQQAEYKDVKTKGKGKANSVIDGEDAYKSKTPNTDKKKEGKMEPVMKGPRGSGGNRPSKVPKDTKFPVFCFNCGQDGHYAPDCKEQADPGLVAWKKQQLPPRPRKDTATGSNQQSSMDFNPGFDPYYDQGYTIPRGGGSRGRGGFGPVPVRGGYAAPAPVPAPPSGLNSHGDGQRTQPITQ